MIEKAEVFLMRDLLWKAEKRGDKKCAIAFLQLVTKELEKVSFILAELEWKEKNKIVWLWEEDRKGKKKRNEFIGGRWFMKTITVEILPNGQIRCDWWFEQLKNIFCSICSKQDTVWCDTMTCLIANKYCG